MTSIIRDAIDMFRYPRNSQLGISGTSNPLNHSVDDNCTIQGVGLGLEEGNGIEYPFWIATADLEKAV